MLQSVYIHIVTSSVITLKNLDDKLALQVAGNPDNSHSDSHLKTEKHNCPGGLTLHCAEGIEGIQSAAYF